MSLKEIWGFFIIYNVVYICGDEKRNKNRES